jgi:hypothetical protein
MLFDINGSTLAVGRGPIELQNMTVYLVSRGNNLNLTISNGTNITGDAYLPDLVHDYNTTSNLKNISWQFPQCFQGDDYVVLPTTNDWQLTVHQWFTWNSTSYYTTTDYGNLDIIDTNSTRRIPFNSSSATCQSLQNPVLDPSLASGMTFPPPVTYTSPPPSVYSCPSGVQCTPPAPTPYGGGLDSTQNHVIATVGGVVGGIVGLIA